MRELQILKDALRPYFSKNAARLHCLAGIALALLKVRTVNINILTVEIAYKGVAFPVIWMLLPKRGNPNTLERIEIIDRFIKIFDASKIQCLTGDREFVGHEWFSYLLKNLNNFRMRIKEICSKG